MRSSTWPTLRTLFAPICSSLMMTSLILPRLRPIRVEGKEDWIIFRISWSTRKIDQSWLGWTSLKFCSAQKNQFPRNSCIKQPENYFKGLQKHQYVRVRPIFATKDLKTWIVQLRSILPRNIAWDGIFKTDGGHRKSATAGIFRSPCLVYFLA